MRRELTAVFLNMGLAEWLIRETFEKAGCSTGCKGTTILLHIQIFCDISYGLIVFCLLMIIQFRISSRLLIYVIYVIYVNTISIREWTRELSLAHLQGIVINQRTIRFLPFWMTMPL